MLWLYVLLCACGFMFVSLCWYVSVYVCVSLSMFVLVSVIYVLLIKSWFTYEFLCDTCTCVRGYLCLSLCVSCRPASVDVCLRLLAYASVCKRISNTINLFWIKTKIFEKEPLNIMKTGLSFFLYTTLPIKMSVMNELTYMNLFWWITIYYLYHMILI